MTQRIQRNAFHPMRGHVEAGAVILDGDKEILTIKPDSWGWGLWDGDGRRIGGARMDAATLTAEIVNYRAA